MRIAILNLTAGGMSGGYKKYLLNMIPRIKLNPSVSKIYCFSHPSLSIERWFDEHSKVEFIGFDTFPLMQYRFGNLHLLEKYSPDVVYVPVERFVRCKKAPVVNMLQNMEPFAYRDRNYPVYEKIKNQLRLKNANRALIKADRVIAISKFVRSHLIERIGIQKEKIGLVYHGIAIPVSKQTLNAPMRIKEHLSAPFIFTAGSIRPARGLEDIINALGFLRMRGIKIILVIGGATDPGMNTYKQQLDKLSCAQGVNSQIMWPGSLTQEEMSWCYYNCDVFVMTSRVEACPNIVLETMAHGCVSISTQTEPMPEIYANAALYYKPQNGEMLASIIQTVLSWNDSKKIEFSKKARERASLFSWDVCAEKTIDELKRAVEKYTPSDEK